MVTSVDNSFSGKGNKSSNKEKALSQFLTRMKARQNFDFKISFFFFLVKDSVPFQTLCQRASTSHFIFYAKLYVAKKHEIRYFGLVKGKYKNFLFQMCIRFDVQDLFIKEISTDVM